ncbi:MAG: hypothetical protein HC861_00645 [Rhodospirillaceae bacterium]|nr:hypothetical protein [Rhodospirillaceae bacterium]
MQELEALAVLSVRRACGFGAIAIATLMLGLAWTPAVAFGTGAVCCLLMALILYWKSDQAPRLDHRKTELWAMLADSHRPPPDVAAVVVPRILQHTYLSHCRLVLSFAVGLMLPAVGLHLAG